jgi:hypothetical protein
VNVASPAPGSGAAMKTIDRADMLSSDSGEAREDSVVRASENREKGLLLRPDEEPRNGLPAR